MQLGVIGALQSRVESSVALLAVNAQNFAAAEGRIRDLDVAFETARYARDQVFSNAATSLLAQANQEGRFVLQLLRF